MLEDQLARKRELRDRETILATTQETMDDLRRRLDKSEERILALAPPPTHALVAKPVEPSPKPPAGFFARLFSRG